jgi:hypothetical protein
LKDPVVLEFISDDRGTVSAITEAIAVSAATPTTGAITEATALTAATPMSGDGLAGAGPSPSSTTTGTSAGSDAVTDGLWALGPRSSRAAPQSRPVFFLYGLGAGFQHVAVAIGKQDGR